MATSPPIRSIGAGRCGSVRTGRSGSSCRTSRACSVTTGSRPGVHLDACLGRPTSPSAPDGTRLGAWRTTDATGPRTSTASDPDGARRLGSTRSVIRRWAHRAMSPRIWARRLAAVESASARRWEVGRPRLDYTTTITYAAASARTRTVLRVVRDPGRGRQLSSSGRTPMTARRSASETERTSSHSIEGRLRRSSTTPSTR